MLKKAYIHTLGCQMNVHDSEKMAGILQEEGYMLTDNIQKADFIIFNTCSIRQKAEQKFQSELGRMRRLKEEKPLLRIAVAGCVAQQKGRAILKRNPHVDFIFGPQNIHKLRGMIKACDFAVSTEDNKDIELIDLPVARKDIIRAWVSIMYGCNNFCSYCVVPYTRGREKSRPSDNILAEIRTLASEGFKEVTLLGQNVNSYKSDVDFTGLLEKIHGIEGIERIRFVTSHPRDFSNELIGCIEKLSKVCEHIHLPLQSGSDRILGLMNRGYTYDDYARKIDALRKKIPGIAITTDIIAGFPSESGHDHGLTMSALKAIEFDGIFAFKYSSRPGTKASVMAGQMPDNIKSERLAGILSLQDSITLKKNKLLEETVHEVLVEGTSKSDAARLTGRTRTNKIVNFEHDTLPSGHLVMIKITRAMRHSLYGEVLSCRDSARA